jgi:hypothetical protein
MIHNSQLIQKRLRQFFALSLIAGSTIACQAPSSIVAAPIPIQSSTTQGTYRNPQLGFEFSYPKQNFVVDSKTQVPPNDPALSQAVSAELRFALIEIWTNQHYQKIKAGAYEGGTEYPANVQVAVYQNPKKLELQNWVKQSDRFSVATQFKSVTVAKRPGIAFRSSGLYEHEHFAFKSDKARIVLITLSKTGYGSNDAIYRTAFDQIVRSFRLLSSKSVKS